MPGPLNFIHKLLAPECPSVLLLSAWYPPEPRFSYLCSDGLCPSVREVGARRWVLTDPCSQTSVLLFSNKPLAQHIPLNPSSWDEGHGALCGNCDMCGPMVVISMQTLSHSRVWGSSPAQHRKSWISVHRQNTLCPRKVRYVTVFNGLLFGRLSAWSSYLIYYRLIVNSNSFPSPSKQITLLSTHVYTGGPFPTWLLWLTSREVTQWAHPSIFCNFTFFLPSSCFWVFLNCCNGNSMPQVFVALKT